MDEVLEPQILESDKSREFCESSSRVGCLDLVAVDKESYISWRLKRESLE